MMIAHISLIVAHNHQLFRIIIQNILQSCAGISVLAKVDTAEELFEKMKELQPDVVLAGLELKGMNDLTSWQRLKSLCGNTKMLITWPHHKAEKLPELMRECRAGYIARDASPAEYLYAVKQVAKGRECLCSQTQILRDCLKGASSIGKNLDDTSLRMLYCIRLGYSNKEIALATGLKESTVKSYRKKLKSMIGFRSVAGLEKMLKE